MNKLLPLLLMVFFAHTPLWAASAAEDLSWLKLGENVECDINMAQKAEGAKWRIGKVHEINVKSNSYTVALLDKSKVRIVNNSKWIKTASDAVTQSFTQPAEIKSEESQRKEKSEPVAPDKSLKNKKGGALSRSALLS